MGPFRLSFHPWLKPPVTPLLTYHLNRFPENSLWKDAKCCPLSTRQLGSKSCPGFGILRVIILCPSFSGVYGGHFYCLCAVCEVTIWCHILVSKPTFWQSLLTQYAYYFTRTLLVRCFTVLCHCIEYQRFNLGDGSKIYSTLRQEQFITGKVSGCPLKQWNKTHSTIRQRSSQVKYSQQAAQMSCRIRVVEQKVWGWNCAQGC